MAHARSGGRPLGGDIVLGMATDNTNTAVSASRAALPTITVPAPVAQAVKAHVAKHGALPQVAHRERLAFGHTYAAGTFTNTTDHTVQALVFQLRNLPGKPSYRTIAVAIGAQCSALTERAAGAHAKRGKVDASTWRTNTGGRAAKAAAAVVPPVK